jgi:hypothetical protein
MAAFYVAVYVVARFRPLALSFFFARPEQASWVVTQMMRQRAEDLFARVGNMKPSKSSLDRLPKALGERWEAGREGYGCARG